MSRPRVDTTPVITKPDVIFTFGFTSWSGAAAREFGFPEDRLATALPGHPRVGRVLICDPFRSAPRKLVRRLLSGRAERFPESKFAAHCAPLRLRRTDPVKTAAVEHTYAAYERRIRRAAERRGLHQPAVVTTNPLLAGFGDFRWARDVTYYAWDDWAVSEPQRRWWPAYYEAFSRLRERARRVVAVSTGIVERIEPTGLSAVVPNGIDPAEWYILPPPPAWFAARPAPRLLYVGTLQSRIDIKQLLDVAAAFPQGSVTLVGPMPEPAHFASLRDVTNITIHPRVPRSQIPGLTAHADVGLIPHTRSALTEAMSPLKLYEYLSAGLPVAAVDLPEIAGVSDRVMLVPSGGDMVGAVRRALALGRDSDEQRLAFIAQNSWERRIDALLDVALEPTALEGRLGSSLGTDATAV